MSALNQFQNDLTGNNPPGYQLGIDKKIAILGSKSHNNFFQSLPILQNNSLI